MLKINELFNVENEILNDVLSKYTYPYEVLPDISKIILELGSKLGNDYTKIKDNVWVHKNTEISSTAFITGPAIIMEGACLRHNAYLRENVIIGKNTVIGNSSEIKNSIIMDNSQIPHFNYVGDSILGNYVHLGAGVIIANLRLDKKNIKVEGIDTNLRKIGAFIGDNTEIGCNSVICPGTLLNKGSIVYPLSTVSNKKSVKLKRL